MDLIMLRVLMEIYICAFATVGRRMVRFSNPPSDDRVKAILVSASCTPPLTLMQDDIDFACRMPCPQLFFSKGQIKAMKIAVRTKYTTTF